MTRRVLISILAATVVAVLVFGLPLARAVQRTYEGDAVINLERQATQAATTVPPGLGTTADPLDAPVIAGVAVAVYGADGRRLSGDGPDTADAAVQGALAGRVTQRGEASGPIVAVPLAANERIFGALRAARPEAAVEQRVHRAWALMALLAVGAVSVAGIIGYRQARRLARGAGGLASAAAALGRGDFTSRAAPSGVAEYDAIADALNTTAGRLARVLERERAFSADASHQLRTPLAGLRLRLEAAQLDDQISRHRLLADALAEVDRLEATVDDLLDLARDSHSREALDVDEVIGDVERAWHGALAAAGRPLRVDTEPDLVAPHASPAAVRQILTVLVANAAEHGAGAVTLQTRAVPGGVAIDVGDEGGGINGSHEGIFERRSDEAAGHGIGLALARSLAEAEGARLVLSRPGPKPVFTLLLPGDAHPLDL